MFTLVFSGITLDLPSPEFDDSVERRYRRTVRESRGKELILFAKVGYGYLPKFETRSYKFSFLSEPLKQKLISFLDTSVGKLIAFTDYNSDSFEGIITTPSTEIVNSARSNNEVTLEIEVIPHLIVPPG